MAYLQVHRFGDMVAGFMGTGETIYLTPEEATHFAKGLLKAAKSCKTEDFVKSTCGTLSMEVNGSRYQGKEFSK